MILDLVPKNDPILSETLPRYKFPEDPQEAINLVQNLADTMIFHGGVGLAANQVGLRDRVFVIKSNPIMAFFNPIIVHQNTDEILLEEGCLTMKGYYVKIKRPRTVKVRYTDVNGETTTQVFSDLTARIVQHETDHLNGIMFTQHANPFHRDQAERAYKKYQRTHKDESVGLEIQKRLHNQQMEINRKKLLDELQTQHISGTP